MVTSKSSKAFRNFALYIRKLRPEMIPRLTLRHYVLLVMGVLIPGLALGEQFAWSRPSERKNCQLGLVMKIPNGR